MRIIAGENRGRPLVAPPGDTTRPTPDRVREALFSMLRSVHDARVLDLFAGTGALGLEALSRGAHSAVFVERDRAALTALRANVQTLGGDSHVLDKDVFAALVGLERAGHRFDLVLMDPPFVEGAELAGKLGDALIELVPSGGRVVMEYPAFAPPIRDFGSLQIAHRIDRRYGKVGVSIITVGGPS